MLPLEPAGQQQFLDKKDKMSRLIYLNQWMLDLMVAIEFGGEIHAHQRINRNNFCD